MEEDIGSMKSIDRQDSEESPVSVEEAVEVTYEEISSNELNSTSDSEQSQSTPTTEEAVKLSVTDILMPPLYNIPANWN